MHHHLSLIVCHSLLSIIIQLSVIPYCLTFTIVCHSPSFVAADCLPFPIVHLFWIVSNSTLSVIHHCPSFPIICHSLLTVIPHCLSCTIVHHFSSFNIALLPLIPHCASLLNCLSFPIVCHSSVYVISQCLSVSLSVIPYGLLSRIVCVLVMDEL